MNTHANLTKIFLKTLETVCMYWHCHLLEPLGNAVDAVNINAAIIHDGCHVPAVRADCHRVDGITVGTHMEKQLASLNVDKVHHTVLAQYTKSLLTCLAQKKIKWGRKKKKKRSCREQRRPAVPDLLLCQSSQTGTPAVGLYGPAWAFGSLSPTVGCPDTTDGLSWNDHPQQGSFHHCQKNSTSE